MIDRDLIEAEMDRRTTTASFAKGQLRYLVVTTVLDAPETPCDDTAPTFFMDYDWHHWLKKRFPGWTWIEDPGCQWVGAWSQVTPSVSVWHALGVQEG